MNVQEFAELAAGHALNALSPDDQRAFRNALAEHPEWAAIIDADVATAAQLGETVDAVTPPAALRGELLSRIAGGPITDERPPQLGRSASRKQRADGSDPLAPGAAASDPLTTKPAAAEPLAPGAAAAEPSKPGAAAAEPSKPGAAGAEPPKPSVRASDVVEPLPGLVAPLRSADDPRRRDEPPPTTEAVQTVARRNWTRGLLALAASFVLLIALGTTAVVIGDRLREPASVAALNEIEDAPDAQVATVEVDSGGTATAHWSESIGKAVLVTDGVAEPASGKTYELWFVRGDTPVSAGLFDTDDAGRATALLEEPMQTGDVIAVTVEDRGGSKTGQPTSDPIFTIPTA
ncbi:anti-sigma factor [Microbacterium sp. BK668]|uniref:anti-sigma factor n=1 Tax=Microbacterium sp. BK668 TaxID=2512118 RepID=UPI0010E73FA3|nr:anti-sigma factor [Microbacterium sp. BK668]TDN92130.1 anti-sigma-K factor RskA [Microbacterium sp. BK668]